MTVVLERDGGDLDRARRLGGDRFETAVRREIIRSNKQTFLFFLEGLRVGNHRSKAFTSQAGTPSAKSLTPEPD